MYVHLLETSEYRLQTWEKDSMGATDPDTSADGVQNTTSVGSAHNSTTVGDAHPRSVSTANMASQDREWNHIRPICKCVSWYSCNNTLCLHSKQQPPHI